MTFKGKEEREREKGKTRNDISIVASALRGRIQGKEARSFRVYLPRNAILAAKCVYSVYQ